MRLQGKVALITGGTSGIGRATARLFAAEGARVAFTGRRTELGKALEQESGGLYIKADHRRAEDCTRSVGETMAAFGRIDILFNNAGIVPFFTAEETPEEVWNETLLINVTAVWRMCKEVLPIMRSQGGGVIVNNASDWGLVGGPRAVAYCASKGAVVQMTKAMAIDNYRANIRINAVCPGDTYVDRSTDNGFYNGLGPEEEPRVRESSEVPIGRLGNVREIAYAALFLASDESSFMTGTTLVVDGGNTAQ